MLEFMILAENNQKKKSDIPNRYVLERSNSTMFNNSLVGIWEGHVNW